MTLNDHTNVDLVQQLQTKLSNHSTEHYHWHGHTEALAVDNSGYKQTCYSHTRSHGTVTAENSCMHMDTNCSCQSANSFYKSCSRPTSAIGVGVLFQAFLPLLNWKFQNKVEYQ